MLRRTTPDGGRIDDAALTHGYCGARRHDGGALVLALLLVLFVARLAGCLVPV